MMRNEHTTQVKHDELRAHAICAHTYPQQPLVVLPVHLPVAILATRRYHIFHNQSVHIQANLGAEISGRAVGSVGRRERGVGNIELVQPCES